MDELKGIFKNYKPSQKYSEAFKRAVVKEFEQGSFSKDFIQAKYGLGGKSVLLIGALNMVNLLIQRIIQ